MRSLPTLPPAQNLERSILTIIIYVRCNGCDSILHGLVTMYNISFRRISETSLTAYNGRFQKFEALYFSQIR